MSVLSQFLNGGGKLRYQDFNSSGTFTPNSKLLANGGQVLVFLVGGGQGGYNAGTTTGGNGGWGGTVIEYIATVAGATTVTIGAGGAINGGAGGDTSFGSFVAQGGGKAGPISTNSSVVGGNGRHTGEPLLYTVAGERGIDGYGGPGGKAYDSAAGTGNANQAGANGVRGQVVFGNRSFADGSGPFIAGDPGYAGGGAGGTSSPGTGTNGGAGGANTGGGGGGGGSGNVGGDGTGGLGGSGFCRVIWFE